MRLRGLMFKLTFLRIQVKRVRFSPVIEGKSIVRDFFERQTTQWLLRCREGLLLAENDLVRDVLVLTACGDHISRFLSSLNPRQKRNVIKSR